MTTKPMDETSAITQLDLPVLPLRDVVVFPHMVIPLFVGRERSIKSLEVAMEQDKQVLLMSQKKSSKDEPKPRDLFKLGTIATVLQLLKLPDGTVKVLVEGSERGQVTQYYGDDDYLHADVKRITDDFVETSETEVLIRAVLTQFEQYVKINRRIPPEIITSLAGIEDPARLADTIAAQLFVKLDEKQKLLEMTDINQRLEHVLLLMETEIDKLQVEGRIRGRVKRQMEKSQREYYLKEQMTAIQKELGGGSDDSPGEMEQLEKKINSVGLSVEAKKKAMTEFNKLKMMSPMSAEATVCRNYLDWMLSIPWKKQSKIKFNLHKAENELDTAHYGLEKVKERILEYLAVQQRVKKLKGPVLCLVGPPGVGKTSLGQSIADAVGRKFVRISLGGVRDEAEIRGHRRTYIGSMPGKVVQKLAKVGVKNPLFLLDEIDKMAMDFRGDPASALLEVLDPEQNHTFNDHYLEVDYDLSDVMFIATANSMNIPAPLLDRMEVIRLSGYTEDEKTQIASRHLISKQKQAHGLKDKEVQFAEESIRDIVRYYTREAGVRNLEREISKVCRKVVKAHSAEEAPKTKKNTNTVKITSQNLDEYLGVKRFRFGVAEENDQVGLVNGLAWTEVGGELLTIEAAMMPGKGKATYTGRLGDVMQESIQAAMTVVRSRAERLNIAEDFYEKNDFHVHVPEGATPKDGPSAGIGMCTAFVSALTKIPVKANVAMTGEITLRGEVLPIGGLKEKLLAALRAGIEHVLIPAENEKDLKEIPENIVDSLQIHPVKWIDEVWDLALAEVPTAAKRHDDNLPITKSKLTKSTKLSQPSKKH